MGLFDKKFCDICGEKIGFLGNRKLKDGNMCKNCSRKLSPFFSERRESTVEEIQAQLAYREENERQLKTFAPNSIYGGEDEKIYVDTVSRRFVVTAEENWRKENPDIISFSQVVGCLVEVEEDEIQVFYTDKEGNEKSYNPPRYQTEYSFYVKIHVDSPYFQEITVRLNDEYRPNSRTSKQYAELREKADEICAALNPTQQELTGTEDAGNDAPVEPKVYNNCKMCGAPFADPTNPPKFCPNCGTMREG